MARKLSFDGALAQDIKSAVSDSYADNIKMINIDDIVANPENFYSMDGIDELADDIDRQGLKNLLVVYPLNNGKYMLKSGHRRREAVQMLIDSGRRQNHTLPCYVDGVKSESETKLDLIMLNATARVYTDADVMQQYKELTKAYETYEKESGTRLKGRMRERIAEAMNVSPAQVGKIENIVHNATPEIITSVEKGDVSISTANEIAKLPKEKQSAYADNIKDVTHKDVKKAVQAQKKTASAEKKTETPKEDFEDYDDEFGEFSSDNDGSAEAAPPKIAEQPQEKGQYPPHSFPLFDEEAEILHEHMSDIMELFDNEDDIEVIGRLFDRISGRELTDDDFPC